MTAYTLKDYWEERLRKNFNLTGVGHQGLSAYYNACLYKRRLEALESGCQRLGFHVSGAQIFEVGCGTGFYTQYFFDNHAREYTGLDISNISIDVLKPQFPDYNFICADITNFDFGELRQSFDIVFSSDVLFHIVDDRKFEQSIYNMQSLLRSGGILIISDIFPQKTTQTAPHVRLRSLDFYRSLLQDNQCVVVHVEPIFAIGHPSPTDASIWWWNVYKRIWKFGFRIVKFALLYRFLAGLLFFLDKRFFLPRFGQIVPNRVLC